MASARASSAGSAARGGIPPSQGLAFPGLAGEFAKCALFKRGLSKEAKPRLAGGVPAGQHRPWCLAPGGLQGPCGVSHCVDKYIDRYIVKHVTMVWHVLQRMCVQDCQRCCERRCQRTRSRIASPAARAAIRIIPLEQLRSFHWKYNGPERGETPGRVRIRPRPGEKSGRA